MSTEPIEGEAPGRPAGATPREAQDRRLDEALAETFPASDPVSITQPAADADAAPPGPSRAKPGR